MTFTPKAKERNLGVARELSVSAKDTRGGLLGSNEEEDDEELPRRVAPIVTSEPAIIVASPPAPVAEVPRQVEAPRPVARAPARIVRAEPPPEPEDETGSEQARRTTGTYTTPYERKVKGGRTMKFAITVPDGFVEKVKQHVAKMPLGTTQSAWVVEVLLRDMENS